MSQSKHILIKNIYWMLCYAFRAWDHPVLQSIDVEEFDDVDNLFAYILSKEVERQLKQGLYREYLEHLEDVTTVHGKIDMQGSIRHKINHRQILSCEYDELSANNLYNRILKTTMCALLQSDRVEKEFKDKLREETRYFSEVDFINPKTIPWSKVRIHRNNRFYCLLIGICRLVLEGSVMSSDSRDKKLLSVDENEVLYDIYEEFVREYYKREFPQLNASATDIFWAVAEGDDTSLLPKMQTDTTLSLGDKVLIIDTKFYVRILSKYGNIRSNHLYQLFAYVKNMAAERKYKSGTVSGMLLYARTDEEKYPNESYTMSGNRIDVRTLDLNRDFSEIRADLDNIVYEFFELERPAAVSL